MQFVLFSTLCLALLQVVKSDCIEGYEPYGNLCYKVSGVFEFSGFDSAASKCQADGGNLASITNAFVDSFVMQLAKKASAADYWIGLKCPRGNVSACNWVDQAPFQYSNFYFGYPAINGDCTTVSLDILSNSQGKWFTSLCLTQFRYVCETRPVGANTTKTTKVPTTPSTTTTTTSTTSTSTSTNAPSSPVATTQTATGVPSSSTAQLSIHPKDLRRH